MDARAYLEERRPMLELALDAALPTRDDAPETLVAAMRHLLFPGGKRLRPGLCFAAAEAVGGRAEDALPVAVAVELVHTYSLIHDDLPCMDDDDLRRGRPTVHRAFDEATALLAGDALLGAAFAALVAERAADPAARVDALRDLADAVGASGLVGGQVDDLANRAADAAEIERVHERKTAALFVAAIRGGARLAGADGAALDALGAAARDVGVAFQIADDLLDAESDPGCSLVRALGPEASRARAEQRLAAALAALGGFGERAEPLRALFRIAVWRRE